MYVVFFKIERALLLKIALLYLSEKCMVTPNFLFGYQKHFLAKFYFLCIVLCRAKSIPVLVGPTHGKR